MILLSRRCYILLIVSWIIFVFPSFANAFVLVIDPGHGGKDTGAHGRRGKEKNINLAVGLLAGQYIASQHPDVKIVYTRSRDVFIGLDERANIANKANANLFISIHTNALSDKLSYIKGAEVYTLGVARSAENMEVARRENSVILLEDNYERKYEGFDPNSAESYIIFEFMMNLYAEQSINFASMVQRELVNTANRVNRGVRQAGYLVLRKSTMPRILIELDYISNSTAEDYLLSPTGQRKLALSICNAFTEYKREFDRMEKNSKGQAIKDPVSSPRAYKAQSPGLVYKVQILASTRKLSDKATELKGHKADYYLEGGYYKYTHGESADWNEIVNLRKKIRGDFKDAFIIAFENGVRVPIK